MQSGEWCPVFVCVTCGAPLTQHAGVVSPRGYVPVVGRLSCPNGCAEIGD